MGFSPVPLVHGTEELVVGRVTICKLVEEDGVEWDGTPVVRGGCVGGIRPVCKVLGWVLGILVEVEVVLDEVGAVGGRAGEGGEEEEKEGDDDHGVFHHPRLVEERRKELVCVERDRGTRGCPARISCIRHEF